MGQGGTGHRRSAEVEYEQMLLYRHMFAPYTHEPVLERSAYILLSRIQVGGPMSIGELSEALGLDVSTLNRQTAAAVRSGLLERIPDPAGGMARKFALTTEGAGALADHREQLRSGLDDLTADWSDSELQDFAAYLRRFNTAIESHVGRTWPRPVLAPGTARPGPAHPA